MHIDAGSPIWVADLRYHHRMSFTDGSAMLCVVSDACPTLNMSGDDGSRALESILDIVLSIVVVGGHGVRLRGRGRE